MRVGGRDEAASTAGLCVELQPACPAPSQKASLQRWDPPCWRAPPRACSSTTAGRRGGGPLGGGKPHEVAHRVAAGGRPSPKPFVPPLPPKKVASDRAVKAGKLLAELLAAGAHGDRPVSLVGHGMGARLIFNALLELCRRGCRGVVEVCSLAPELPAPCLQPTRHPPTAHPLIPRAPPRQNVVLLGAPVETAPERWAMARRVVAGRLVRGTCLPADWVMAAAFYPRTDAHAFAHKPAGHPQPPHCPPLAPAQVNCYSRRDWLLGVCYGGSVGWMRAAAGLVPIESVPVRRGCPRAQRPRPEPTSRGAGFPQAQRPFRAPCLPCGRPRPAPPPHHQPTHCTRPQPHAGRGELQPDQGGGGPLRLPGGWPPGGRAARARPVCMSGSGCSAGQRRGPAAQASSGEKSRALVAEGARVRECESV